MVLRQDLCKSNLSTLTYVYPCFTFFYTPLYWFLICELRGQSHMKRLVIQCARKPQLLYHHVVVHTCWFCLNRVRASWSMYFLSTSVSLLTPLCACQVRAMRNTLMYSDNTFLGVEVVIGAKTQQLASQDRNWSDKGKNQQTLVISYSLFIYNVYQSISY